MQGLVWMRRASEKIALDGSVTAAQRADQFLAEARLWVQNRAAWQLQSLTDLEKLPEVELMEGGRGGRMPWGYRGQDETGYPVDGSRFFTKPQNHGRKQPQMASAGAGCCIWSRRQILPKLRRQNMNWPHN